MQDITLGTVEDMKNKSKAFIKIEITKKSRIK